MNSKQMPKHLEFRTELSKDGDRMGVRTEHSSSDRFLHDVAVLLSDLIDNNEFEGDWEFQLVLWLPDIVEVSKCLQGLPSDARREVELVVTDSGIKERAWCVSGSWNTEFAPMGITGSWYGEN